MKTPKAQRASVYQPQTPRRGGNPLMALAGFGLPFFGGSFLASEYTAYGLQFDPALGGRLAAGIYQPLAYWPWALHYYSYAPQTFNIGLGLFATTFLAGSLGYVIWRGMKYRSARQYKDVLGSAAFATPDQVREAGLLPLPGRPSEGVFCGLYQATPRDVPLYLRHDGPEHVFCAAPTRSGKGVSLIVPTLLTWPHSLFAVDMKGENYELTAGWRALPKAAGGAGNRVLRFEPGSPEGSARWNPLDEIRHRTLYEVADADNMASILIEAANADEGGTDSYFKNAGRNLLSAAMIYTRYLMEPHRATLADCYTVLTGGDPRRRAAGEGPKPAAANTEARQQFFMAMQNFQPAPTAALRGWDASDEATRAADAAADAIVESIMPKVRLTGARLVSTADEEVSGIFGSAATPLEPYLDPILKLNTSSSDFVVTDLMNDDKPVSLYYVLPGTDIERLVPLTRLLIITMMRKLAPRMERDASGTVKAPHKHRLLMMMDEFPILGRIAEFQTSMAFLGGFGIKVYLIAQDLPQIVNAYGPNESIIGNCHIRIFFTPNRLETAEPLSRALGKMTVVTEQTTESGARFGAVLGQVSRTYGETQRDLMTPDELLAMKQPQKSADGSRIIAPGAVLIWVAGRRPILAEQSLWFLDPVLVERPKIAPPAPMSRAPAALPPGAPVRVSTAFAIP